MKIQVNLPETSRRQLVTINVEIKDTEEGPIIVLSGLSGEEIDSFLIAKWYDHSDLMEEVLEHECEDCDEQHCSDGECCTIDKSRLESAIDEVKHAFHAMERIIDNG